MITDYLTEAIKTMIEVQATGELANCGVYTRESDESRSYPAITITETGIAEHEVLEGNYEVGIEIMLETIPNAATANGTTAEEHRALSKQLYDLIQLEKGATFDKQGFLNSTGNLKVFAIHEASPLNTKDEGRNVTTYSMDVVCCVNDQPIT